MAACTRTRLVCSGAVQHQLANCASEASNSSSIALWIRSNVTSSRIFPLRRRMVPSSPAKGPDLIRTCLPEIKNGYGFAFQTANDDWRFSISLSGNTAKLPLTLSNRIIPGRERIRILSERSILTNTYPGKRGSSTSTRRLFQQRTAE